MSKRKELRCFDYVNRPYAQVADALSAHASAIFERATHSAADRANDVGAELRVRIGAIEIAADIDIAIREVAGARSPANQPATQLDLVWKSQRRPGLFPEMTGSLLAYALAPRETQIEFAGTYDPPLGVLGDAIDAIALHRIAEESVQRFVNSVAAYLRAELPVDPGAGDTFALPDVGK
ncbi:MAG TPA: hypothetical protein VIX73_09090 [Kofleriaceae bacterium]